MLKNLSIAICILLFTNLSTATPYYTSYRPRTETYKQCSNERNCYSSQYYKNKKPYSYRQRAYGPRKSYNNNFLPKSLYVGAALGHTLPIGFDMNPGSIKHSRGSPTYNLLLGTDIYDWLRIGTELSHNQCALKESLDSGNTIKAKLSHNTIMLNSYLSLPQSSVKPYLLLGVGLARNTLSDYRLVGQNSPFPNNTTNNFAYQIGGGISFPYQNFVFDGEIKYIDKGTAKTKLGINGAANEPARQAKIKDLIFLMSLRYYFYNKLS